jgi:hypothetical protein
VCLLVGVTPVLVAQWLTHQPTSHTLLCGNVTPHLSGAAGPLYDAHLGPVSPPPGLHGGAAQPHSHPRLPQHLLYVLLSGLVASRFGLWLFDLAVTQLQQELVLESQLGECGPATALTGTARYHCRCWCGWTQGQQSCVDILLPHDLARHWLVPGKYYPTLVGTLVGSLQSKHHDPADASSVLLLRWMHAGTVSGVQASLQSAFEVLSFVVGAVINRPQQFHWLMAGSCTAVLAATGLFQIYACRERTI